MAVIEPLKVTVTAGICTSGFKTEAEAKGFCTSPVELVSVPKDMEEFPSQTETTVPVWAAVPVIAALAIQ